ncbi:MAG: DUF58 domain-containing protein [Chloroflexota bacterium]|nr:DUF58 domain-containing protein [Chloroflexota bacterium]
MVNFSTVGEQAGLTPTSRWSRLWNRRLPPLVRIHHRVLWPLLIAPLALLNQLVTPHPIWLVLLVAIGGLYGLGYYWVRSQALTVTLHRARIGTLLVAGDALREEFELRNSSHLPVLWAEFVDGSTLPGYQPGRIVACGAHSFYRWHGRVECRQRGVYQLGPHQLTLGDPFGLFTLTIQFDQSEAVLIYPRVAHLPQLTLPHGSSGGTARRRCPLWGALPSASVREHQITDSLRYIHWPITAHRGKLMVKELEIEPSGAVWIVLDLNRAAHSGAHESSTLETAIIVAASISAELLNRSDRRAVGLLTVSGQPQASVRPTDNFSASVAAGAPDLAAKRAILVAPQAGQAHLWEILAALAPLQPTDVTLAELLRSSRHALGRRRTLIVITPHVSGLAGQQDWVAELVHLQSLGLASSVLLVTGVADKPETGEGYRSLLARYEIGLQTMPAGTRLPPALTFRRKRKVIRNTPTGGAVTYEVEEEVG